MRRDPADAVAVPSRAMPSRSIAKADTKADACPHPTAANRSTTATAIAPNTLRGFLARHRRSFAAPRDHVRKQLVHTTVAWVFGASWMAIATSAVMFQYARSLGVSAFWIGLLSVAPPLAALAQLPTAWAIERFGHRRLLFLWLGAAGRSLWIVAALVPWVLPEAGPLWSVSFMVCVLVSWLLMQAGGPAWINWMGDVIPRKLRGRYMAMRGNIGSMVVVTTTLVAGWALDQSGVVSAWLGWPEPVAFRAVASGLLLIAGVLGTLDILTFLRVPDHEPPRTKPNSSLWRTLGEPLADRRLHPFLAFSFFFALATGFVPGYVVLYLVEECGFSNKFVNFLMFGIPPILGVCVAPFWGRLLDRVGKKPTLLIAGWCVVFGGGGWLWVSSESWVPGYLMVLAVVMAWPGVHLAIQNFLFDLSSDGSSAAQGGRRGGVATRKGGASYVAVCSIATALGGGLSGLLGGTVAVWLEGFRWLVPVAGITLTYHGVLILTSIGIRAVAMGFVFLLHEPEAKPTTHALRYMTGSIYTNLRDITLTPRRVARRSLRWAKYNMATTRRANRLAAVESQRRAA